MLAGHALSFRERNDSYQLLLEDPVSDADDEEADSSKKILYIASFEELANSHVQYDTIIWISISALLVLAWGIGILLLLYLPIRRYVLQKDISSRKLYITPYEIVYKATRPKFLPFIGVSETVKRVPLHLIIDIIVEQGFLQAMYGIHTIRVENIARRKAAPVDELQVQGVSNPDLLRKVIVAEAAKRMYEIGNLKSRQYIGEGESASVNIGSLIDPFSASRFQSPSGKSVMTPRHPLDGRAAITSELLLHKVDEVIQSVQRIEELVGDQKTAKG